MFKKIISLEKIRYLRVISLENIIFRRIISLDYYIFRNFAAAKAAIYQLKKNNIATSIMYYKRHIDKYLSEWASRDAHKPILLRGARQVGKSTAVRQLGRQFASYVEINLEREPQYKVVFLPDLNVDRIVSQICHFVSIR